MVSKEICSMRRVVNIHIYRRHPEIRLSIRWPKVAQPYLKKTHHDPVTNINEKVNLVPIQAAPFKCLHAMVAVVSLSSVTPNSSRHWRTSLVKESLSGSATHLNI